MIGGQGRAGKTAGKADSRSRARRAAALGFVALLAAALPATGQGAAGADSGEVVTKQIRKSPAEIRDYWTRARMREAQPLDLRLDGEPASSSPSAESRGEPSLVAPAGPGVPETKAGLVEGVIGGPQTQSEAEDASAGNTTFPRRTHGKVFITIPDTGDFVCSGTVVRSQSHTLVWTAGHCVLDRDFCSSGCFVTNFMFVPGYRDFDRPFGTWTASDLLTTPGWQNSGDLSYDAGAALMRRDGNGRGVQDIVGGRGIAFNQSRNQTFVAHGYPQEPTLFRPEFDGQRLYTCVSPRIGDDDVGSGPPTIQIDCDMSGGSSGGGWVVDDQFVNGLISYGYVNDPFSLYGPYFGGAIKNLYEKARGKKRRCSGAEVTNLGTGGSDEFEGTAGKDSFKLRSRGDTADARGGNDRACGGKGADRLLGGNDDDTLKGGKGKDFLDGGSGFDVCKGGKGRDRARDCEERKKIRG